MSKYDYVGGYEDNSERAVLRKICQHPIERMPLKQYYITYKYHVEDGTLCPYWEKLKTPNQALEEINDTES